MPFDGNPHEHKTEVRAKPDVFSPEHFEEWLASMPRSKTYNWRGHCLYKQYGEYCGAGYLKATDELNRRTGNRTGGEPFRFVALNHPHTFGGALRRLRLQRHGILGTARIYFREWRSGRALQSS